MVRRTRKPSSPTSSSIASHIFDDAAFLSRSGRHPSCLTLRACDFIDSQGRPLRFLPRRGRCPKGGGGLGVHHSGDLRVERPSPPPALRATSPYGGGNQESMWKWNKITSSEAQARRRGSTRVILFKRNLLQLSSAHRVARWAAGKAKRPVFRPSVSIQNRGEEAYAASFSSLSPEGPLSLPLAETSRSMNSITAIGAASPKR